MAKKTQLTSANFKRKLASFLTAAKTQRDNAQEFIVFGLEQFRDHGNTGFLTMFLNGCVGIKSMPTRTLKDYIVEHAGVVYAKLKDDTYGFKKSGKGDPQVTMPEVVWYEWEGGKHNKVKPMDVVALAKSLITRIEKAQKEGKIKDEQAAIKIHDGLKALLPA